MEEWYAIRGELVDSLVCLCRVRRLELSVCDGFEVAGCWGNNCQVIRVWLPKGERTTAVNNDVGEAIMLAYVVLINSAWLCRHWHVGPGYRVYRGDDVVPTSRL